MFWFFSVQERGRVKKTGKITKGKENVNKVSSGEILPSPPESVWIEQFKEIRINYYTGCRVSYSTCLLLHLINYIYEEQKDRDLL